VDRRARLGSGTSDPTSATITASKPTAAGRSANPNPASGSGDHPNGRIYLVNASGTHQLGDSQFAQAIWRATSQPQERAAELATTSLH
jgi:hypothetical protein